MDRQWTELARLADLIFQKEAGKLQQIKQAQSNLGQRRARLTQMDGQAIEAMRGPHEILASNGDVAWQAWVGRNRRQQGIEEAQLRAILEIRMPAIRKAYGRKTVLEKIATDSRQNTTRCW